MKEIIIEDAEGRPTQVQSDGRTVWVNAWNGALIGRFSRVGIDVHALPESSDHCLDCRPIKKPGHPDCEDWEAFVKSMKEHHSVDVPGGLIEGLG